MDTPPTMVTYEPTDSEWRFIVAALDTAEGVILIASDDNPQRRRFMLGEAEKLRALVGKIEGSRR